MWSKAIEYISKSSTGSSDINAASFANGAAVTGVFILGSVFGVLLTSYGKTVLKLSRPNQASSNVNSTDTDTASSTTTTEQDEGIAVLEGAMALFSTQLKKSTDTEQSNVVNYISPEEMASKLFSQDSAHSMDLSTDFSKTENKVERMLQCFRDLQEYSVNTNHPFFFNQLFGAVDPVALAAEVIASGMNTSVYTYETAPVFTILERDLFTNLGKVVFPNSETCDGLMLPGGSLSNLTALHVARHLARNGVPDIPNRTSISDKPGNHFHEEKKDDESVHDSYPMEAPELVAFVSNEAHYSFKKACSVIGLGQDNLIAVPTKQNGPMDAEQLELLFTQLEEDNKFLERKRIPYFVGLTAGSTVRGSYDDIEAITRVCKKQEERISSLQNESNPTGYSNKIWVHVDGAWGGPAVFSQRADMKALMKGVTEVDSFTFNPHKMLGAPQQTTCFLSRHEVNPFSLRDGASLLFHLPCFMTNL